MCCITSSLFARSSHGRQAYCRFSRRQRAKLLLEGEFSDPVCICILSKRWIDCVVFPHVFGPTNTVCWANGHAQRDELAAIGISSLPSPEGGARQREIGGRLRRVLFISHKGQ